MFTLYPYQHETIDTIKKEIAIGVTKMAVMLPTGTGKTVIEASLIEAVGQFPVAVVVPWRHLVDNAYGVLCKVFGEDRVGMVMADRNDYEKDIVVISIQTILSQERIEPLEDRFKLVIVDEMHYFMAERWGMALDILDGIRVGFSATIGREDRKALAKRFGKLVYYKPIHEMIDQGYLCDLVGIRIDAEIDMDTVPCSNYGDYNDKDLDRILNTDRAIELLYQGWKQYASDRVTIAFTPTIEMAQHCAEYWIAQGESADWVCGAGSVLSEREVFKRVERFTGGQTQIIFNAAKLAVGFDHRPIGCVYIIRPTKSQTFYIQLVGRGTRVCSDQLYAELTQGIADRVAKNKRDCLILNAGGSNDLGLVQFPHLFDLDDETTNKLVAQMRNNGQKTKRIISYSKNISTGKIKAERVDLFNNSAYNWIRVTSGWTISSGAIQIMIDRLGTVYTVRARTEKEPWQHVQPHPVSLDWAMAIGEEYLRKAIPAKERSFYYKKASWRKGELSEKQYVLLQRMRPDLFSRTQTYHGYMLSCAQPMTKGEAAELITKAFATKDIKK